MSDVSVVSEGSDRPNFLIICVDQQPASHLGFAGDHTVQTPHLDKLAHQSVVFNRAYVANPICMPNRATLITGLMPSAHGTRVNGLPLDPTIATMPSTLAEHGYSTGAVGKLHHQNIGSDRGSDWSRHSELQPRAAIKESRRLALDRGWDDFENAGRHRAEWVNFPDNYYGYQRVDLIAGHSDYASGHYYEWALQRGVRLEDLQGRCRSPRTFHGWDQVYETAVPEELCPTSYVVERSITRLREFASRPEPFLLFASFPDPHHPFTPPSRFWNMYRPDDVPLPVTFSDSHPRSAPHFQRAIAQRGTPPSDGHAVWAPTAEQFRAAAAAAYGLISFVDEGIGAILAELERLGLGDSTVVIFTSDHGDMFGDHGLLLKTFSHYDGCVRVPLLVRAPGREPRSSAALVGTLDLAQTVLDLAGLNPAYGMQGRSLRGLIDGETQSIRDALLIEEDSVAPPSGLKSPPQMRTVITDEARLTIYGGCGIDELYDFTTDPDEMDNLARQQSGAPLADQLRGAMVSLMAEVAPRLRIPTGDG